VRPTDFRAGGATGPISDREARDRLTGIALMCAAVTIFAGLDSLAKYAGLHGVPPIEVSWARYAMSLVFAAPFLKPWRNPAVFVTRRPLAQALRALLLLGSTIFNFIAVRHLQLAQTVSITFATPLIVTALAGPILGEWAGPRRWAAVVVGFVGVLIVVQPQPGSFQPAALLSIASMLCYAGYVVATRLLAATETAGSLLIYGSLLATLLLTPALPLVAMVPSMPLVIVALCLTGVAGAASHWLLILANRRAPATLLVPFSYIEIIPMVASGYFIFDDLPPTTTLIGAAVIIASGLYILYRQQVHRDRR
jgi:drug/metabolite transporter (DMT)-like permease